MDLSDSEIPITPKHEKKPWEINQKNRQADELKKLDKKVIQGYNRIAESLCYEWTLTR